MIEDLVKRANENSLLKAMNARIKAKRKNLEQNRKKYWKLSATERLHYDSRSEKISEDNSAQPFYLTMQIIWVYFYFLVVFTLFKILFQVDPVHLVNAFLAVIGTAPIFFQLSIFIDVLIIFVEIVNKRKRMKDLNKKYGFKEI